MTIRHLAAALALTALLTFPAFAVPAKKIDALTDGSTIQTTDQIPVNRGGATRRVVVGALATKTQADLTADVTGALPGANGGSGVANTGKTVTLGGNLTTSGANATTLTTTGTTNVTLPTAGTLATLAGSETLTNKAISGGSISGATLAVPSSTFAGLPAAASSTGLIYRVTDVGTNGCLLFSNGTNWKPFGGSCIIYQSGVQSAHTGDTSESNVAIVTIPAGLLSANGGLRITALWGGTGTAGTHTPRIYFSATSGSNNGTVIFAIVNGATSISTQTIRLLVNRNSVSSQINTSSSSIGGAGAVTSANTSTAINTANAAYLNFTVQNANSADTATLEAAAVEWIEP